MQRNTTFPLLLVCFFLSGLAGLIYQTAWTREFAFVFGTSNLAVATVLAAYMAGLAAGAAVAARYSHRITRPVLAYGLLELGVGISALGVPFAINGSQALHVALLGGQAELSSAGGFSSAIFYMVCSFVILMVPTAMMGATLPLLVRYSVQSEDEIGSKIGLLYSINTAGAVVGTIIAAFLLLPTLGLRQTIYVAAGFNGLVFLAAWALARSVAGQTAPAEVHETRDAPALGKSKWILPLIFGSGLVSFTYEVLWVRLLEHMLGGSVYAFSTMLASFLAGIALGSAVASRLGTTRERAALGFAVSQLGVAGLSLAAFLAVDQIPSLTGVLRSGGYSKFFADWAASSLTLFPGAVLIGATFPFAVRVLARGEADAGPASARVYAANTLGSVVGSIAAGFYIIPLLGYAGTLAACVALNLLLAMATAYALIDQHGRRLQIAAVSGLVALAIIQPEPPWKILRYSELAHFSNTKDPISYLGIGRAATVLLLEQPVQWLLRTNGNPEGRITRPGIPHEHGQVARWLTGLPSMARPEAKTMLVVGFGAGLALETVPSLIEEIDVIELETEVIEANRSVADLRWKDPLKDPRITVHTDDARSALILTTKRFDAIVSQPSHPWTAGASHLYTQEFFELAKDHLEPEGVFVQWIGLQFVDEALFRTLLATLAVVYEHVQVYNPTGSAGVLFLASDAPFDTANAAAKAVAKAPETFVPLHVTTAEDVLSSLLLGEEGVRELALGAEINRDDYNILQLRSPRIRDRDRLASQLRKLTDPHDPLPALAHAELDLFYLMSQLSPIRGEQLAETLENPLDQEVAGAVRNITARKRESARKILDAVLVQEPRHLHARAARLGLSKYALGHGTNPEGFVAAPYDETEQVVLRGWSASVAEDWETLRTLEPRFAAIPRTHPLAGEAVRLRAEWRIASGEPSLGLEAATIIDRAFRIANWFDSTLLRAEASLVAGDHLAALDSLSKTNRRFLANRTASKSFVKRARRVLHEIPRDPKLATLRVRVDRLFGE
jgi:spermidine synthase